MKFTQWIFLALLCFAATANARSVNSDTVLQPLPEEGIAAFRAGDYAKAESIWIERLARLGAQPGTAQERGQVCYNLGNAAYRSGQEMEALAWYTAARKYIPRDEDLLANMKFVRGELALPPEHSSGLLATLSASLRSWTYGESKNIALAGVVLLLLALGFEALRGGSRGRGLAFLGLILCSMLWLPFLRHALAGDPPSHMVIAARGTNARSEPRPDSKSLLHLEPTDTVDRLDEWGEWTKLRAETGEEVWVNTKKIMSIDW